MPQTFDSNPFIGGGNLAALLAQIAGGDAAVNSGLQGGAGLADMFFAPNSFGRVTDTLTPDVAGDLIRLQDASHYQRSGEAQAALDALRANAASAGDRGNLALESIDRLREQINLGATVDPNLQFALERRRQGLDGLQSSELTALREQGTDEINNRLNTALRQARFGNIANNLSGGVEAAALPGIVQESTNAQRNLERDILLANVDERNRRLTEFENLANTISTQRFERIGQATQNFANFGQNQEQAEFDRQRAANTDYAAHRSAQEQTDEEMRRNRLGDLINFRSGLRNDFLNRQLINLDLASQERSGALGSIFGAGSFAAAQQGRREAADIGRRQLGLFGSSGGSGGGSGGGGGGTPGAFDDPNFSG